MKLKDCRIIVVTPFHERAEISEIFWQGINDLKLAGINIRVVAIISDPDNEKLAKEYAFGIVYHSNNALGMKWDSGISALRNMRFDYLCILGSDDICSPKLFKKLYRGHIRAKCDYFGIKEALAMDFESKKFRYWTGYTNHRSSESLGVARMISRKALVKCDFALFPRNRNIGMDLFVNRKLASVNIYNQILETEMKPYRMGVKVTDTLTKGLETFMHDVDLKGYYSTKLIKMLKK